MGWQTSVVQFLVIASGGPASGLFVYNGPPGPGNDPVFAVVAPGTTTDPYGNTVKAVMNAGLLAGAHFGLDDAGNAYLADSSGDTRIYISPGNVEMAFYDATTSQVIMSAAAAALTDPLTGDSVKSGFSVYGTGTNLGKIITLQVASGNPTLFFLSGRSEEDVAARQSLQVDNIGLANELLNLFIIGPSVNASPDFAYINLQSAPADASGTAGANLVYRDTGGTGHALVEWGSGGLIIPTGAQITAGQPGSPLTAEVWHTISLAAGWSTAAGQPVPSYRLLPDGNVQMTGVATHASFTGATALTAAGAIPAAYRPTTEQFVPAGLPTAASIEITPAGTINAEPPSGGTTVCNFNGCYPVNL